MNKYRNTRTYQNIIVCFITVKLVSFELRSHAYLKQNYGV